MPEVDVVYFKDDDGSIPVLEVLEEWRSHQPRAFAKFYVWVEALAANGYDLHRPKADFLRDHIHELRFSIGHVNYRVLYFFHERSIAVLAHSITKEDDVPKKDIDLAVDRRKRFLEDPQKYTHSESEDDDDQRIEDSRQEDRERPNPAPNDRRRAKKSKSR